MKLIIADIGNTFCKLCIVDKKNLKIEKIINIPTKKITTINFLKNFLKKNRFIKKNIFYKRALFASVSPKVYYLFKKFLKINFKINSLEIKNKKIIQVVKINIQNKNEVGSDRIANATGAYKIYKNNCIIVDFGTATTFDVVMKNGIYNGGVIAPGIELSAKTLHMATAKLPLIKMKKVKKFVGKNTSDAMSSGFFCGYLGLIKYIVSGIKKETNKNFTVLCTGGLAKLFSKYIDTKSIINENITIKGIIEIYKKNKKIFEK